MAEVVALLALVTALVVLATAVVTWRTRRQVQQVHVMINSQRMAMRAEVEQLKATLRAAGVAVPPVPSEQEE